MADTRIAIGTHVELYGAVGPSAGVYRIILDSLVIETFNASRSRFSPHTLLYVASGLIPGTHTVGLSNSPARTPAPFPLIMLSFGDHREHTL